MMSTDIAGSGRSRTAALLIGLTALVCFIVLRSVVALQGHEPLDIDILWHDLMASAMTDAGLAVAEVLGVVGGTIGMIVAGALIIALLAWRRHRGDAAALAIGMIVVVAIGATMAAVIGRTRPADSLAERMATSFPSGHTAVATTVALLLALILRRWYVWLLAAVWVLGMMWSRTYLQAHWLSDVVAGMLEGAAVALLVWVAVDAVRHRHAARTVETESRENPIEG